MICKEMYGSVARILEVECAVSILLVMYQEPNQQIVVDQLMCALTVARMVVEPVAISRILITIVDFELC